MANFLRWIQSNLAWSWLSAIAAHLWPGVLATMTFVVGYNQIPIVYALVAAAAMFAFLSFGAFYFHQLIFQRSAEFKLMPVKPEFGVLASGYNKNESEVGIKLGITLASMGMFPIEYKIEKMKTIVDGHIKPGNKEIHNLGGSIYPNLTSTYWDSEIFIPKSPARSIDCFLEVKLIYGKIGKLKFPLEKKYKLVTYLSSDGAVAGASWFYND